MAKYIDGYVVPIPKKNLAAYRRMAKLGCKVWLEHGALAYREAVGDDLDPCGLGFTRGIKLEKNETVVFAYVVFRSRKHRDQVNKRAMSDLRLTAFANTKMPFDVTRMLMGGFTTLVEG